MNFVFSVVKGLLFLLMSSCICRMNCVYMWIFVVGLLRFSLLVIVFDRVFLCWSYIFVV